MPKIVKNGKEYSGVPLEVVTAWQPTGDPVQVAEPLMGNTDISDIGDGTITGAISAVGAGLSYNSIDLLSNGNLPANPKSTSSETYTAPQDGIIFIWAVRGSSTGYTLRININGHQEVFAFPAVVGYSIASISFPVKEGYTVNLTTDNTADTWTVHQAKFIY